MERIGAALYELRRLAESPGIPTTPPTGKATAQQNSTRLGELIELATQIREHYDTIVRDERIVV